MLWDCFEQPPNFSNQWLVPMLTRLRTDDLPAWREERRERPKGGTEGRKEGRGRREGQRRGKKGEAKGKDRGEERRERPEGGTEGRKGGWNHVTVCVCVGGGKKYIWALAY